MHDNIRLYTPHALCSCTVSNLTCLHNYAMSISIHGDNVDNSKTIHTRVFNDVMTFDVDVSELLAARVTTVIT